MEYDKEVPETITFRYDEVTEFYRMKMRGRYKGGNEKLSLIIMILSVPLAALMGWIAFFPWVKYLWTLPASVIVFGIVFAVVRTGQRHLEIRMTQKAAEWKELLITLNPDSYVLRNLKTGQEEWDTWDVLSRIQETDEAFRFSGELILDKKYLCCETINQLSAWLKVFRSSQYENRMRAEEELLIQKNLEYNRPRPEFKTCLQKMKRIYSELAGLSPSMLWYAEGKKKRIKAGVRWQNVIVIWCAWGGMQLILYTKSIWPGVFMLLSLVYWYLLFAEECRYGLMMLAGCLRGRFPGKGGMKRLDFDENGITLYQRKKKERVDYEALSHIVEGESYIKLGKKLILPKALFGNAELEQLRRVLKGKCGSRYVVTQNLSQPHWWKGMAACFCLLLSVFLLLAPARGRNLFGTNAAAVEKRYENKTADGEPGHNDRGSQAPSDTLEGEVGTTQIRDGVFREKVADLHSLNLSSDEIYLPDNYRDRAANENTFLRIEGDTLYASSYNQNGQLGLGDKEEHFNAKGFCAEYEIDTGVVSASVGRTFISYLKNDETLYAAGEIPGRPELPKAAAILTDVAFADSGEDFILALKKDGSVWILGTQGMENSQDEPAAIYPEFTKIFEGARYAAAGRYTAAVLLRDGSLWLWGDNSHGQCGKKAEPVCYTASEAVRVAGKSSKVFLDKPEIDTAYNYVADPGVDESVVLSNYRTYIRKKDGSMIVCGEGVTEDVFMELQLIE